MCVLPKELFEGDIDKEMHYYMINMKYYYMKINKYEVLSFRNNLELNLARYSYLDSRSIVKTH